MTRQRGLFLDLDGTLSDSLPSLREAYYAFLADSGAEGTDAEFNSLNGPPLRTIVERLRATHGLKASLEECEVRYQALIEKAHLKSPPANGAAEMLMTACSRGWTVCVVTSAQKKSAQAWLRHVHLNQYIDALVGGEDVAKGKPDPEPYRLALRITRCDPGVSLAIEDSPAGVMSSTSAPLPTFLIGKKVPGELAGLRGFLGRLNNLRDLAVHL
jgi:HAD superfamily hydrolase (TIGR01509 family)